MSTRTQFYIGHYVTQSDWMAAEKTEDDSLLGPFGHLDSYWSDHLHSFPLARPLLGDSSGGSVNL